MGRRPSTDVYKTYFDLTGTVRPAYFDLTLTGRVRWGIGGPLLVSGVFQPYIDLTGTARWVRGQVLVCTRQTLT